MKTTQITRIATKIASYAGILTLAFGAHATIAEAAVPSLSVSSSGTNSVQITVNGDQNQNVSLYYYNIGSSAVNTVGSIGTTNSSGYFSNTLNTTSYGIPAGANVYVVVNGQQSSNATWPSTSGGNVYLSQSSVTMSQGQTASVSISGGSGNNYYVSSNSNTNIVTATVSGNMLTLNAMSSGYAVISVCSLSSYTGCASVTINISGWNGNTTGNGTISLSQSSVTVAPGQSQSVAIYSSNGTNYNYNQNYYISNNPGSQYFTASISGNSVIVYGSNPGSATINICSQYSGTSCVSLYVTVAGSYYNGSNYNNYNGYNNGYNGTYYNYNSGYTGYNGSSYTYPTSTTYPNYTYTSYTNPTTYAVPSTYTYPTPTYVYTNSGSTRTGNSISGVFLSQIPSTGISFGLKMTLFALGLALWSLFAAFMISRRKDHGQNLGKGFVSASSNAATHSSGSLFGSSKKPLSKAEAFKFSNMKKKGII